MTITRKFLDWSRPALPMVVDYLVGRYLTDRMLDLERVVLVLPGGRAGRRLMEMLAERAQQDGATLYPPQIRTAGTVPELLYESTRPFAADLVQQLAWVQALRQIATDLARQLVAEVPGHDDHANWMDLARQVWRQHRELAADGFDFAHVANQGPDAKGFQEVDRWSLLRTAQEHYLGLLDGLGLWDLQTARLFAIEHRLCATDNDMIFVAMADMNRVLRLMLDQLPDRVTALIHAPESWAERFDQYGCLIPDAWQDVVIPLDDEQVSVRQTPTDQANAVPEILSTFDGNYRADQVVVGVIDERLVPQIQRSLLDAEVTSRWVVGSTVADSAPYRLLVAIAKLADQGRLEPFASLVRHPDVEQWLEVKGFSSDYLSELDRYRSEHLQPVLGEWLGRENDYRRLRGAAAAIQRIARSFQNGPKTPTRTLVDWGGEIIAFLSEIYKGRDFDRTDPNDLRTLEALTSICSVLGGHQQVPVSLVPQMNAGQAIGQVLDEIGRVEVPSLADDQAVELLGWLELPLDSAPAVIVTSFNEGLVPKSVNSDLFLPNALRRALGLVDNTRRYARDAYGLSVLVASREKLSLIVGRRNADGDPLIPSRLLFAADPDTMARRAVKFFQAPESSEQQRHVYRKPNEGDDQSSLFVPLPSRLTKPIESMRVTAFRDYLACPYRYYLRHVLKLETLDDEAYELDARQFGILAHNALCRFSQGNVAESADAREIQRFLSDALNREVDTEFGRARFPAVEVQLAQLRARFDQFAVWQADWSAQGWGIVHAETAGGESPVELSLNDGNSMVLRGRIDRIDRNRRTGEWAILDYKTSDSPKTPESTHFTSGRWVDLQLPLYRCFAKSLAIEGDVKLGYIVLPKDVSKVGPLFAGWDDETLDQAELEAVRVATAIRNGEFWPPTVPPPKTLTDYSTICQDQALKPNFAQTDEEEIR